MAGRSPERVSNTGYTPTMAKVMVSLPDDLLRELDREAQQRGTTRSGLLRDYVQQGMERRSRDRAARMKELLAGAEGHGGSVVEALREERQGRLDKLDRLGR
jgi:predicted transcriptional regulator